MRSTLITVLGLAAAGLTACQDSTAPTTNDSAAQVSSATASASSISADARTVARLTAPLNAPFVNAKGKATFITRINRRELEIEVEHIRRGITVNFFVGGNQVGSAVVDQFRNAAVDLNTKNGDTVPLSVAGQLVEVKDTQGVLIASGSF